MADDAEQILQTMDKLLEREEAQMVESKRLNHQSWDNHVLTLSAASIGFAFTFLPIANGDPMWLSIGSAGCLVLAILVSMLNFSIAAHAHDLWDKSISAQMLRSDKIKRCMMRTRRRVREAHEAEDMEAAEAAQNSAQNEIEKIYGEFDVEKAVKVRRRYNFVVTMFNHARGVLFVAGIAGLTIFGVLNISNVSPVWAVEEPRATVKG